MGHTNAGHATKALDNILLILSFKDVILSFKDGCRKSWEYVLICLGFALFLHKVAVLNSNCACLVSPFRLDANPWCPLDCRTRNPASKMC